MSRNPFRGTPNDRPDILSQPRIVLAIDYGTTFTGLAWMQMDGEKMPQLDDLNLFVHWPGKSEAKVPSEVSYSLTTGESSDSDCQQWGFSIDGNSKVLRWTKLELVKNRPVFEELDTLRELVEGLAEIKKLYIGGIDTTDVPRHLTKTSEDIIEFYLGHIAREWHSHITRQAVYALSVVPVDIVVTHPAMWPDDALNSLLRAVCGAFNEDILPTRRHIHVVTEPEACALYVIQDVIRSDTTNLRIGDCFVLCDAGGGTIDAVSYCLLSLDPLKLKSVGKVTGAPVGATTVDRAFLRWLDTKLTNVEVHPDEYGKAGHYILMPQINLLLKRFEVFKRSFTGTESYDLSVPRDIVISSDEGESSPRQLNISSEKMKELFRESIEGVRSLILKQVTQVEEELFHGRTCRVSSIFLAGGFAESEYLFSEVKKTARRFGYINVQRAPDCWSSVVKGAVLRGTPLGAELPPRIAICPRRYGLKLEVTEKSNFRTDTWVVEPPDDDSLSSEQLIWLVEKGDIIFYGKWIQKSIKLRLKTTDPRGSTSIIFIANDSDRIPGRIMNNDFRNIHEVEALTVRLDGLKTEFVRYKDKDANGKKTSWWEIVFDLNMSVKQTVVIEVKHHDRVLASHTTASL